MHPIAAVTGAAVAIATAASSAAVQRGVWN